MEIDIIRLNKNILEKYKSEIEELRKTISNLSLISAPYIEERLRVLRKDLQEKCGQNLYLSATLNIIFQYKNILINPSPRVDETINATKTRLVNEYLSWIKVLLKRKSWFGDLTIPFSQQKVSAECSNCFNKIFEIDDACNKTCSNCSVQTKIFGVGYTHTDCLRVKIVGKFGYNRSLHFEKCLKQFQGKPNCKIDEQLYKDLDAKFKSLRLLVDSENPAVKYSRITKEHVMMFLKELKRVKHYKNINVIFDTLTNADRETITEVLEKSLLEDFKTLVNLYDVTYSKDKPDKLERKNFMNVQYILYQLLKKHDYPCKLQDFSILKTADRKQFHDKICSNLFQKLGWKFTPTF